MQLIPITHTSLNEQIRAEMSHYAADEDLHSRICFMIQLLKAHQKATVNAIHEPMINLLEDTLK